MSRSNEKDKKKSLNRKWQKKKGKERLFPYIYINSKPTQLSFRKHFLKSQDLQSLTGCQQKQLQQQKRQQQPIGSSRGKSSQHIGLVCCILPNNIFENASSPLLTACLSTECRQCSCSRVGCYYWCCWTEAAHSAEISQFCSGSWDVNEHLSQSSVARKHHQQTFTIVLFADSTSSKAISALLAAAATAITSIVGAVAAVRSWSFANSAGFFFFHLPIARFLSRRRPKINANNL